MEKGSSDKAKRRKEAKAAFKKIDTNGDGKITLHEFARYVVKNGIVEGDKEAGFMFRYADSDKDGFLSIREVEKCFFMADEPEDELKEENLEALFSALDADGNETLDFNEVKKAFQLWGEQISTSKLQEDWENIDTDGNGVVDFSEFKLLVKTHCDEKKDNKTKKKKKKGKKVKKNKGKKS